MLPAAYRLRSGRDIAATVRGGRRAGRRTLVVHLAVDAEPLPPRAAFVVSRAVGGAVVRNTVTRRLRPLVAARLPGLPAGSRLVVRALPPAAQADSATLETDLAAALDRLAGTGGRR